MTDCPDDLYYSPDHEWVAARDGSIARVGITAYAAAALGDIVFVSLPSEGDTVNANDSVAELESTKSVSEAFCPVTGVIVHVNEAVVDTPEIINEDPYGVGWLFEIEMTNPAELDDLLDCVAYADQLT